ncbi:hypothetical protein IE00_11195 [Paracoccus sp. SM22M-07]|nr:hypothetical protein IE00_11195 [Paracoccus sp. SM22M-07]
MMLGSLLALAACGSGGGDNDDPLADYNDDAARAVRIVAETQNLAQTSAASMPVRGRAEYDGVVGLAFGDESASLERADVIDDLYLDADFVAGTIRSEMDDFNTRDSRELEGELRVTDGRIDGSGFSGTERGTLAGGADAPGRVDATVQGGFPGLGADDLSGSGTGSSAGGDVSLVFRGQRDLDRDAGFIGGTGLSGPTVLSARPRGSIPSAPAIETCAGAAVAP